MAWIVANKATGRLYAARFDQLPFDPATEVRFELLDMPNSTTQRWDGAVGVRAATPQELDAAEDAKGVSPEAAALVQVLATRLSIPRAMLLADVVAAIKANRG
jgi:hypothetical protein